MFSLNHISLLVTMLSGAVPSLYFGLYLGYGKTNFLWIMVYALLMLTAALMDNGILHIDSDVSCNLFLFFQFRCLIVISAKKWLTCSIFFR